MKNGMIKDKMLPEAKKEELERALTIRAAVHIQPTVLFAL